MAKEGTLALNQAYSIENGAFNFVATCVMTEAGARALGFTDEMLAASFLSLPGGGASRVFGPDGRLLAGEELEPGEDGFAVWDVDLGDIASSKQLMDGVGHYSRPDIFRCVCSLSSGACQRTLTLPSLRPADCTPQTPATRPSTTARSPRPPRRAHSGSTLPIRLPTSPSRRRAAAPLTTSTRSRPTPPERPARPAFCLHLAARITCPITVCQTRCSSVHTSLWHRERRAAEHDKEASIRERTRPRRSRAPAPTGARSATRLSRARAGSGTGRRARRPRARTR